MKLQTAHNPPNDPLIEMRGALDRRRTENLERILGLSKKVVDLFGATPGDEYDVGAIRCQVAHVRRQRATPAQQAAFIDGWRLCLKVALLQSRHSPHRRWLAKWQQASGRHGRRSGSISCGIVEKLAAEYPQATAPLLWRKLVKCYGRPTTELTGSERRSRPIKDASGIRIVRRILTHLRKQQNGQHVV